MPQYELQLVSHTHWDREWYLPFEQFRFRLVRAVDRLLDLLEADADFAHFSLDGQTIVLEDYLALRPEQRDRLTAQIRAGRIAIGPWYVLPDEWVVSGESIVRNLLRGRRIAAEFGGGMDVGYLPDMFGHIGQMPQILLGFGLENAILFRGLSGGPDVLRSEFLWEGLDGSTVLAVKLPDSGGYSNALAIPTEAEAGVKRLREIADERIPYATTPYLLGMNGADHREAEAHVPAIARAASREFSDLKVVHGSLSDFMHKVEGGVDRSALQVIRGELRRVNRGGGGGSWNFLLPHVLSSRIYLKLANDRCQRLLERWAEPFAALAWAAGGPAYPAAFLNQAWAYVLKCHPHDDIGGCSVDPVHRSMAAHFEWAAQIGEQVQAESLKAIADQIDLADVPEGGIPLVVYNPSAFVRSGLVEATVRVPVEQRFRGITVTDGAGRSVPCIASGAAKRIQVENFEAWPAERTRWAQEVTLRFRAESVPGLGWATYVVKPERKQVTPGQAAALAAAEPGMAAPVAVTGPCTMENQHLAVTIQPNGALTVTHKASGRVLKDLGAFEDGGDVGDGYTYSYPAEDRVCSSLGLQAAISLVEASPALARFRVDLAWPLPAGASSDRQRRSEETAVLQVSQFVTLEAGSQRVEIRTVVVNNARDHRLRVLFPSNIAAGRSFALTQFGVTERPVATVETPPVDWNEEDPAEQQQVGFAGVELAGEGLAVISQGLPEYAVLDRPDRAIAVTLLRATGYLASPDARTRWFPCGPEFETPEGQCPGTHEFRYAVMPYQGTWAEAGVHLAAEAHNQPFATFQPEPHPGKLPLVGGLLSLDSPQLLLSSVKQAETGDALIIRCYNPTGKAAAGTLRLGFGVGAAWMATLSEERLAAATPEGSAIPVAAGPGQIVTLAVKPTGR